MLDYSDIELLNQNIHKPLLDIKLECFIFNGKGANQINSVYLRFDNWISLFFDDGALLIKEGLGEKMRRLESSENIIEYQYMDVALHINNFNLIQNKTLTNVIVDESELILRFENNKELIIYQEKFPNGEFGGIVVKIR